MKRIFVLCLLSFMIVGCQETKDTPTTQQETTPQLIETDDSWGIELYVEDVTSTSLTLFCSQNGGEITGELQTGEKYWIEQKVDDKWQELKPLDNPVWPSDALIIQQNQLTSWDIDWQSLYGELSTGKYRIGKEIDDLREAADYDEKSYYGEFVIE